MTFQETLIKLDACEPAQKWAADKTIEEVWGTCERGDWMLWLAQKANIDLRTLTLAKGRCAELAVPYMTDQRSINAVKVAIAFGRGEASEDELCAAADAARTAASDAVARAAYAAAYESYAAARAADAAEFAAFAAFRAADASADIESQAIDVADTAYASAVAAARVAAAAVNEVLRKAVQAREGALKKCADIVREVISVELIKEKLN